MRTVEERLRAISGRADALASAAVAERQAVAWAAERAKRRAAEARIAAAVASGAKVALASIERSLRLADQERQQAEVAHQGRDEDLKAIRARIRDASAQLDKVVDAVHGVEVARAGRRLRIEQVEAKVSEDFAIDVEALVAEYGPGVPVPSGSEEEPAGALRPGRAAAQGGRWRSASLISSARSTRSRWRSSRRSRSGTRSW